MTKRFRKNEKQNGVKHFLKLAQLVCRFQLLEKEIETIKFEIEDSEKFITHLRNMLGALEVSILTYEELGGVEFEYCPACFTAVAVPHKSHHCHLCKEPLSESEQASRTLAVKLDIQI